MLPCARSRYCVLTALFANAAHARTKDFLVMGPQRMLAATSAENLRRTFVEGGLGDWIRRMEECLAEPWKEVTQRIRSSWLKKCISFEQISNWKRQER